MAAVLSPIFFKRHEFTAEPAVETLSEFVLPRAACFDVKRANNNVSMNFGKPHVAEMATNCSITSSL